MTRIRTLLVANRGEIARRVFRTCRRLGISTVAVFSEADAEAAHVHEADRAICLGPGPAHESYLRGDLVLAAALKHGVDAIHPGYGFLSENADFAEAVIRAGLIWVGPPASAMRELGAKAPARQLAVRCGVPVVPGHDGDDDEVTLRESAMRLGFPMLIKASGGGGGRGMRRVDQASELDEAITSARREAVASFGDGRLLLERYVLRPRHIEVQVLADQHGQVVHLFERECSIQRRHQKIVEEAPSPFVTPALRQRLGEAAVQLARAVGYTSAGTVEFIVDQQGNYFFLEMNTRLQVEHPVTELITGLDLVGLQIAISEGRPLGLTQDAIRCEGHAIEVRLCAEDPARDFLPGSGHILEFDLPEGEGLRNDVGYRAGDDVPVFYDSMLAKMIAWGPDRASASRRLEAALWRAWVPGVVNNLPLLRDVLADEAWLAGDLDTGFLARRGLPRAPPMHTERAAVVAAALAWALRPRRDVPDGWRVDGPASEEDRWAGPDVEVVVGVRQARAGLEIRVGGTVHVVVPGRISGRCFRVRVDDVVSDVRFVRAGQGLIADGETLYLHLGDGEAMLRLVPRFPAPRGVADEPGTCVAPTPGVVRAVNVMVGQTVRRGEVLVVLEAMKMEHALRAPDDGLVLAVPVVVGEAVDAGAVLVRVAPAEAAVTG